MSKQLQKKLGWYGEKAAGHWEDYLPKMVANLKKSGKYKTALRDAERNTETEIEMLASQFVKQGESEGQALVRAEEIVLPRYVLLPAEESEEEEGSLLMREGTKMLNELAELIASTKV